MKSPSVLFVTPSQGDLPEAASISLCSPRNLASQSLAGEARGIARSRTLSTSREVGNNRFDSLLGTVIQNRGRRSGRLPLVPAASLYPGDGVRRHPNCPSSRQRAMASLFARPAFLAAHPFPVR